MFCTKCSSESVFKSGFVKGEQHYRCRDCGRQFVPTRHHGKSETQKLTAILLYINGLSLRTIARLIHVTATAVLKWVRQYALLNYEKPKPQQTTPAIVIELDEVGHYLKSKKNKLWIWKAYCRTTHRLLDWECGGRDSKTLQRMLDRLRQWNVKVFFADHWEAYAEFIPQELLIQTKAQTHGVERDNFRQRHWFARFRRKTCVVSRSQQMVDLTMSLYAKFWVNNTFNAKTLFS